jgi:ADP-ribose pyrophosphatase
LSQFRRVGERPVYEGRIWRVDVVEVEGPDGRFERDLVRSRGAVGVVPVLFDPEGVASVVLVRQYRAALDHDLLEIPAGLRDVEGEDPEATARRELVEEVGLAASRLELLTVFANSAGMTDARTHVYLATGLRSVPSDRQGPEEAAMEVVQLPLAEAVAMAGDGRIEDAKTIIGLLLTGRRLADGDAGQGRT